MWLVTLMGLVLVVGTVVGVAWFLAESWWERRQTRLTNELLTAVDMKEDATASTVTEEATVTPTVAPVKTAPQSNSVSKAN